MQQYKTTQIKNMPQYKTTHIKKQTCHNLRQLTYEKNMRQYKVAILEVTGKLKHLPEHPWDPHRVRALEQISWSSAWPRPSQSDSKNLPFGKLVQ